MTETIAGATLIRAHPKDAGLSGDEFLSFEINRPVNLYVAYDVGFAPPAWLKGIPQRQPILFGPARGTSLPLLEEE